MKQRHIQIFFKNFHTSPFAMRFHLVTWLNPSNKTSVNQLPLLVAVIKKLKLLKILKLEIYTGLVKPFTVLC